jgi:hypothetical protein
MVGLIVILALAVPVAADNAASSWSWNAYNGTYPWQVTVTEDQSGCGGGAYTNQYSVPVQYNAGTAVMGDVGHGPATGMFTSGNILHIPGRIVADPPGSSTLSAYDVYFTTDCTAFTAKYTWDYTGPDGACSGSTTLNGASSSGCPGLVSSPTASPTTVPAQTMVPEEATPPQDMYAQMLAVPHDQFLNLLTLIDQRDRLSYEIDSWQYRNSISTQNTGQNTPEPAEITQARADLHQVQDQISTQDAQIEKEYQMVLVKDPTNIQANWDMAQLKKSQNQMDSAIVYAQNALKNPNSDQYEAAIEKGIADNYNLRVYPSPDNSNFVATVKSQLPGATQNIYGTNVQSQSTEPGLLTNLWNFEIYVSPKTALQDDNLVNQAVYGR